MLRRRLYTIYIVLGVAALVALGFWLWERASVDTLGERGSSDNRGATITDVPPKIYPKTISETEQKALDLPREFSHPRYKFSFRYPAGFTATTLPSTEEGGETIVVQNQSKNAGFQIHLESYGDPDTDITKERLARDIPEMKIGEAQEVLIGASGQAGKGLAFIASDTGTREVWFIFSGTLYQLTAPIENDTLLQRVLGTWAFQ